MGKYHNPASEVAVIGRWLNTGSQPKIERLTEMLRPGEVVVGLTDNGLFQSAPLIREQADVDEFYRQYARGQLLKLDFYAVPTEKLNLKG